MASLAEIRAQHPEYGDMPDGELADRLYQKFYSDMPRAQFDSKLGLNPSGVGQAPGVGFGRELDHTPSNDPLAKAEDAATAYVGGVVGGMPVIGPSAESWINDLADHLAAHVTGKPYGEVKAHSDLVAHDINEEHPLARGAGELTGGLLGYGAAMKVAPQLFGGGANSLLTRSIGSGATNALIGAADASERGGSPNDVTTGAGIGGLIGSVVPGVGSAVGAIARPIARGISAFTAPAIPGLRRSAAKTLRDAVTTDSAVRDVPTRLRELGPEALLPDAGPTLLGVASGVSRRPGYPRSAVVTAMKNRDAQTPARVEADLTRIMGPDKSPKQASGDLKALGAQEAAALQPLWASAPPVNVYGVVADIDRMLQTAVGPQATVLKMVKSDLVTQTPHGLMLTDDAQKLNNVRINLDNLINYGNEGLGVPKTAISQEQGAAKALRAQISQALKKQVPGYEAIMNKLAPLMAQREQILAGTEVLDTGKNAIRPDDFAAEWAALSPEEQAATKVGTRSEMSRLSGGPGADRSMMRRAIGGEGNWNREKLATMYGQQGGDDLVNMADRETQFYDSKHRLVDNSVTATSTLADKAMNPPAGGGMHIAPAAAALGGVDSGLTYAGLRGVGRLIEAAKDALRSGRNNDIARAITSGNQITLAQALTDQANRLGLAGKVAGPRIDALARALLGYEGSVRQGTDFAPLALPGAILMRRFLPSP